MNFKFSIGKKIGLGFGLLLFCTITIFLTTRLTLDSSKKINKHNTVTLSPSVDELQNLKIQILESQMLITNWANVQTANEHPEKEKLRTLIRERYPILKEGIEKLSKDWSSDEVSLAKDTLFPEIAELFDYYNKVMTELAKFEDYDEPSIQFVINFMIGEGGDIPYQASRVISHLDKLILSQRQKTKAGNDDMLQSFNLLGFLVNNVGIALFLGGIIIAFLTIRTIVKPVQKFKKLILLLGKGIIPEEKMKPRSDEIGDMAVAFNDLVAGFKRTTEFSNEIGAGNFETEYQPLSESDELGHSLLTMRKDLHGLTSNLEQKVRERTEEVMRQKKEIEELLRQVGKLLQDGTRELADLRQEIGLLGESLLAIYPDRDIAVAELGVTEWIAHFDTVRLEHSPDASSKSIVRACERIRRITKRYHRKTADILEQHLALITQADMLIARLNTGLMEGPVVGGSGNQMQRISVVERQENVAKDFEFIAPLPDGLQETILSFFRRIQPNPFRRFLAKIGRG